MSAMYVENYKILSVRLRALINQRGETVKGVANAIGIDPSSMSRYLNAKRVPDLDYVIRISQYFDVSMDWLLGIGEEETVTLETINASGENEHYARLLRYASAADKTIIRAVLDKYDDNENA